jgi:hypothetical protein
MTRPVPGRVGGTEDVSHWRLPTPDGGGKIGHPASTWQAGGLLPQVRKGRPRQDSNLRTRLRRPMLYPLSYGGSGREKDYQYPAPP